MTSPVIHLSDHGMIATSRRIALGGEGSGAIWQRPRRDQEGIRSAPSRHQVGMLRKSVPVRLIATNAMPVGKMSRTKSKYPIRKPLLRTGGTASS